jgi:uncharacterized protein
MDHQNKKLHLNYPCSWVYKIIGTDENEMQAAVSEIIQDRSCKISLSRQSENAKYVSLNLELTVESESHRIALYELLRAHKSIKVVL